MVDFINFGFVRQTTHLKVTNSGHFVFIKRLFLQKFLEVNKIIGDAVNVRISLFFMSQNLVERMDISANWCYHIVLD